MPFFLSKLSLLVPRQGSPFDWVCRRAILLGALPLPHLVDTVSGVPKEWHEDDKPEFGAHASLTNPVKN